MNKQTIEQIKTTLKADLNEYLTSTKYSGEVKEALYHVALGYSVREVCEMLDNQTIKSALSKALTTHKAYIQTLRTTLTTSYLTNGISEDKANGVIFDNKTAMQYKKSRTGLTEMVESLKGDYIDLLIQGFKNENESLSTRRICFKELLELTGQETKEAIKDEQEEHVSTTPKGLPSIQQLLAQRGV
ncbi:hypothetical protein M1I53_000391 [Vibrio vulnificus]|nr:hypothetical protein [Vibrio vulnificus]